MEFIARVVAQWARVAYLHDITSQGCSPVDVGIDSVASAERVPQRGNAEEMPRGSSVLGGFTPVRAPRKGCSMWACDVRARPAPGGSTPVGAEFARVPRASSVHPSECSTFQAGHASWGCMLGYWPGWHIIDGRI